MASPEHPPPRPKYLGPAPPPYPCATSAPLPGPARKQRWKPRHLLAVAGLSIVLAIWIASNLPDAGQEATTEPVDETQALIDEVINGSPSPPSAPTETTAPAPKEVARFSGAGSRPTPSFTVDGAWEVRWESPSAVSIVVYRASEGVAVGVPSQAAASGSSFQPDPGSYLLGVTAAGDWTVTVVQLASE